MKVVIQDDEGRKFVVPFVREEITIGRLEGNTIRLTERNVSRKHARLFRQAGGVVVEDLSSYNGVRINGDRIRGAVSLREGDLVQIGDYDLAIESDTAPNIAPPGAEKTNPTALLPKLESSPPPLSPAPRPRATTPAAASAPQARSARHESTAVISLEAIDRVATQGEKPAEGVPLDQAPRLIVLNTELAGREFSCILSTLTIGRAEENDISLDHRSLSRTHCRVYRDDEGRWQLVDGGSANGIKVNGESYAQTVLRPGDLIELGHVKLRFASPDDPQPALESRPFRIPFRIPFRLSIPRGKTAVLAGAGAGALLLIVGVSVFHSHPAAEPEEMVEQRPPIAAAVPNNPAESPKAIASPEAHSPPEPQRAPTTPEPRAAAAQKPAADEPPAKAKRIPARSPLKEVEKRPAAGRSTDSTSRAEALKSYEVGMELAGKGQYRQAVGAFKKALSADPSLAQAHANLGSCYAQLGDPRNMAYHYEQFVRMSPSDPNVPQIKQLLQGYYGSHGDTQSSAHDSASGD